MNKEKQKLFLPSDLDGRTEANSTFKEFSDSFTDYYNPEFLDKLNIADQVIIMVSTLLPIVSGYHVGMSVGEIKQRINDLI